MKTTRLSFIFLALFVSNFALAAECGSPVTMEAVNNYPQPPPGISAPFGELPGRGSAATRSRQTIGSTETPANHNRWQQE
jgi:hypothetical protein